MKTDPQVLQDVVDELQWEPSVNAAQIRVAVHSGVVTLAGQVGSYADKLGCERAAQRIAGVTALANQLEVNLPFASQRADVDIAHSAVNILLWYLPLTKDSLNVVVEDAWITLSGQVDWQYQRRAAADAVLHLMGVRGVSDEIAVKTQASNGAVKADIEAAFHRRARDDDAQEILVDVQDSDVTLSGTVHSWSDRELARYSAWCTPGVSRVVDMMIMTG
jgi:osmotically-inducible protein OsmY